MDSTSQVAQKKKAKPESSFRHFLKNVLGAEFLLAPEMRPWYAYILFVFVLMGITIVSEQSIVKKKAQIEQLENQYKAELSKLKTNNQFIPYEENQILIETMQSRGYILDEKHNYTVPIEHQVKEKRRWFRKEANDAD